MTKEQIDKYPVSHKLQHRLWLETHLHPFGFHVSDNGRPSLHIRISSGSLLQGVSMEDRVEFMMEAHARMLELGFIRQGNERDPRPFIEQTEARGVQWYWLPEPAKADRDQAL